MIQQQAAILESHEQTYLEAFGGLRSVYVQGVGKPVQVFPSLGSVVSHVRKHMLNPNEVYRWMQIEPGLGACIGSRCDLEGLERVSRLLQQDGKLLGDLYRHYVNAIERALDDAIHNGWVSTDGNCVFAVGLSGLLVVISEGVIRTAFFPAGGCGQKAGVSGRGDRGVYKNCFRPTLRFVGGYGNAHMATNSRRRNLYQSLSRKLPTPNLSYTGWRQLGETQSLALAA